MSTYPPEFTPQPPAPQPPPPEPPMHQPQVSGAYETFAAGPRPRIARPGYVLPLWIVAASLAVLAVVAVVWTVELIRLQLAVQHAAQQIESYLRQFAGGLPGGGSTCLPGDPTC